MTVGEGISEFKCRKQPQPPSPVCLTQHAEAELQPWPSGPHPFPPLIHLGISTYLPFMTIGFSCCPPRYCHNPPPPVVGRQRTVRCQVHVSCCPLFALYPSRKKRKESSWGCCARVPRLTLDPDKFKVWLTRPSPPPSLESPCRRWSYDHPGHLRG